MVGVHSFLQAVRNHCPLVHHITNWVTVGDCTQVVKAFGGPPVMAQIVSADCMSESVIGTFSGAVPDQITEAAVTGLVCYEVAAEPAMVSSRGPSSLKQHLFDRIYHLTGEVLMRRQSVKEAGCVLKHPAR